MSAKLTLVVPRRAITRAVASSRRRSDVARRSTWDRPRRWLGVLAGTAGAYCDPGCSTRNSAAGGHRVLAVNRPVEWPHPIPAQRVAPVPPEERSEAVNEVLATMPSEDGGDVLNI